MNENKGIMPTKIELTLEQSNDGFTSSDDESLFDEDILEDNVKIYSNPFFDFDNEYISSNVSPLFDEDECFDMEGDVDEINDFDIPLDFEDGYYDSEGDVLYLESFLSDDTTLISLPRIAPDYEDSRAHGFVHRSLELQSLACLYMGIEYPRSC
nr:hypothetical protein [Tanacetum cinerariifolium]